MATKVPIENIPYMIRQQFSALMLQAPCPKFKDDLETIYKLYDAIYHKIFKKDIWSYHDEIITLMKEFEELYERTQEKEKKLNPKIRNKAQEAFYRLRSSDRRLEKLLRGFKYGARAFLREQRCHSAIYKDKRRQKRKLEWLKNNEYAKA